MTEEKKMLGIKEIIDLGQEAAMFITDDLESARTVTNLHDAVAAIKTALDAGKEYKVKFYQCREKLRGFIND